MDGDGDDRVEREKMSDEVIEESSEDCRGRKQ